RKRGQRLYRFVGEDRPDVEVGQEGVGLEQREHDDQKDEQHQQAPDRDRPRDRGAEIGGRCLCAHDATPACATEAPPPALAVRRAIVKSSCGISVTMRPRLKTSARWQMRSTSSKSDEISRT